MKTINAFTTIGTILLRAMFISLLTLTAISCSNDEDEEAAPTPEPDVSFSVQLVKIRASEISGEGNDALEVFGEINASLNIGTTSDNRLLWSTDLENNLSVTENDSQISGAVTFTVKAEDVSSGSIVVAGDLQEWDGGTFIENLGQESITLSLTSISSPQEFQLTFSDAPNQTVALTYQVSRQ